MGCEIRSNESDDEEREQRKKIHQIEMLLVMNDCVND
jgi:hypothetical protein